jgi:Trk K+ transport system NAD-binding subunit
VLHGDAADEDLLLEENIENTDVFCAVTNDDEANILSAMLAKRLGARKVMALINRPAYVDLVQSGPIDIAISPQQATIGSLLKHVRRGDVVRCTRCAAARPRPSRPSPTATGLLARWSGAPSRRSTCRGHAIGAIVRGDEVLIAHHDTVIESEDHVILFLQDKRRVVGGGAPVPGRGDLPLERAPAERGRPWPAHGLFSLTMLPPVLVSLIRRRRGHPFLTPSRLILGTGLAIFLPVMRLHQELRIRDGFLIVVLFWVGLGLAGALPFVLAEEPRLSITDAVFESMSGLTTTGATVIVGLDDLPKAILFYRQQLQWLGGMGIIVLAVAVLPMLGVGGMQLFRAEMPGPMKDAKLTPRITETAKALWYIYAAMTVACTLAYWGAGMTFFDAIGHAFSPWPSAASRPTTPAWVISTAP